MNDSPRDPERVAPRMTEGAPRPDAPLAIAHVLSSLGMGGQERLALDLARGQASRGHRLLVVSLDPAPGGPLEDEFLAAGIELAHAPKQGRFDPTLRRRLAALFSRRGIDLVHTHNPLPLIVGAAAARGAGAALVHTKHGINPWPWRQRWRRRRAAALASAFVAVSGDTADAARRTRECPEGRLHVVQNGIDTGRFGPSAAARKSVRAELGIPESAHLVGTVGRLFAEKGHAFLLRAADPLLGEDFHIAIAGSGPEAEKLASQRLTLSAPSAVHLLGARRDVPRLLAAFDTFVLPSSCEGLPLVAPEAMATGLPVVATAVGGLPGVVTHEETGFLVDYGDEAGLRSRLAELAADRERGRRLGARGRERALAEFSVDALVERYLRVYRAVLPAAPTGFSSSGSRLP